LAKGDRLAGENGRRWFSELGAKQVQVLPIHDRQDADDSAIILILQTARLVYMLGGTPAHLAESLKGSLSMQAIMEAYQAGAVIGGSSAGAMVLCEYYYNPQNGKVNEGLGLLKSSCILPHYQNFGYKWAARLTGEIPQATLVGLDERTAIINDALNGSWQVYGDGSATIYHAGQTTVYLSGDGIPTISEDLP
jgi:cyanophycinase